MRRRSFPSALRSGFIAVVASNLVAPVGVVVFGWSTAVLLAVFVAELAAVLVWSVVRIPFAARRPNNAVDGGDRLLAPLQAKRGATPLPGPFPPLYLRNVPTLVVAVALLAPLELTVAFGVFGLADPTITAADAGGILLGSLGVFVGRGVETYLDYFRGGGYRTHSPRSVLLLPFKHLFGVAALLFLAGPVVADAGSDGLVAVVLAGKLLYDLRAVQVEGDPDARGVFYRLYGSAETEIDPVPVAVPEGDPVLRTRLSRRVVVADALYRGVRYTLSSGVLLLYAVAAGAAAFGASLPFVAVPLVGVFVFGAFRAVSRYLRCGTLEHRWYDGVVVAHDALVGEPQARLERTAVTGLAVDADPVDRAFGTRTIRLETSEDGGEPPGAGLTVPDPDEVGGDDANANLPLSIPHVDDPEAVADAFGVAWLLERDAADPS